MLVRNYMRFQDVAQDEGRYGQEATRLGERPSAAIGTVWAL
jgi:hypothetical protein